MLAKNVSHRGHIGKLFHGVSRSGLLDLVFVEGEELLFPQMLHEEEERVLLLPTHLLFLL